MDVCVAKKFKKRNSATNVTSTKVPGVISGNAWLDNFSYGSGINIVTGEVEDTALQPFTVSDTTLKTVTEYCQFIQTDDQYSTLVGASASANFNINGVNANASADFLSSIQISELSMTLCMQYTVEYASYDQGNNFAFTPQAKKVLNEQGVGAFRNLYGDYFISGGRKESIFMCLFILTSNSVEDMIDFKAAVGANAPDVFDAEASTQFNDTASSYGIEITYQLFMSGITGQCPVKEPYDIKKIYEALDWFKANETGEVNLAQLTNYSQLSDLFQNTVDIAPDVFTELSTLYQNYWLVKVSFNSMPPYYQQENQQAFNDLTNTIQGAQSTLATDPQERSDVSDQVTIFLNSLYNILGRMAFYFAAQETISSEPAQGTEMDQAEGASLWTYGYTFSPYSGVSILSATNPFQMDWKSGHREITLTGNFPAGINPLIVGWQIVSNRDKNGFWQKACPQIIMTSNYAVYFQSDFDRGVDWDVVCYFVDADQYMFGQ